MLPLWSLSPLWLNNWLLPTNIVYWPHFFFFLAKMSSRKIPQSVCAPSSPCFEQRIWLFFFFSFSFLLEYDKCFEKLSVELKEFFFGDLQPQASPLSMSAGLPFYLWSSFLKYFGLSLQIVPVLIEYRGFLLICCHWQFMSLKRGSTTCMCLF